MEPLPFNPYMVVGRFEAYTAKGGVVIPVVLINCSAGEGRRDHLQVCHPVTRRRIPGEFVSMREFNESYGLTPQEAGEKTKRRILVARLAAAKQTLAALQSVMHKETPAELVARKMGENEPFGKFVEKRLLGEPNYWQPSKAEIQERRQEAIDALAKVPEQHETLLTDFFGTTYPA